MCRLLTFGILTNTFSCFDDAGLSHSYPRDALMPAFLKTSDDIAVEELRTVYRL